MECFLLRENVFLQVQNENHIPLLIILKKISLLPMILALSIKDILDIPPLHFFLKFEN
jgi:hypothetical protein